jgi:hypothetical protein
MLGVTKVDWEFIPSMLNSMVCRAVLLEPVLHSVQMIF